MLTICTRRKLYVRNPCLFHGFCASLHVPSQQCTEFCTQVRTRIFSAACGAPTHQKPRPTATMGPSYGHRAVSCAETRKQPNGRRRGDGVFRGTQETTGIQKRRQRGKTEANEPSYGGTRDNERGKRKQPKRTRRGAGVTRGTSGTTATPENKERAPTEAIEPSYG